ncbi:MAG TPA: helix-turn-helix domain-containing protein [Mycobacteriales bacterium]|nr:helix-turn-helix domain-containing protein [Mycobacteriales bacterium]
MTTGEVIIMASGTPSGVGENLARIRTRRGMTPEELAERSGVTVATVRKLEQGGRATARVSTLHRLARGLSVRTSDLFGVAQPEPANGETQQVGLMALRHVLTPARSVPVEPFADDDGGEPDLARLRASVDAANRLYHHDDYPATSRALPALISEARAAERGVRSGDRDQALILLGQALQLAGSVLIQTRQYDLAYQALSGAIDAVESAGQPLAAASGVVSLCWLFLRQGRFAEAEEMATRTADDIEPRMSKASIAHMATWGWLLLRGSAAAVRDNRIDEADDMLRLARAAASRIGRDIVDFSEYWTSFGPSTVAMKAAENAMVAGQPGRVLDLAGRIPSSGRPTSNNRNRCMLDVANAHLEHRSRAEALQVLFDIRSAAPEWLRQQRYAKDIVGRIVETRVRALSAETRELADFLAVPY